MRYGRFYRVYTESTTCGNVREVYGQEGGCTGDVYVVEYPSPTEFIAPVGVPMRMPWQID